MAAFFSNFVHKWCRLYICLNVYIKTLFKRDFQQEMSSHFGISSRLSRVKPLCVHIYANFSCACFMQVSHSLIWCSKESLKSRLVQVVSVSYLHVNIYVYMYDRFVENTTGSYQWMLEDCNHISLLWILCCLVK